MKIAYFSHLDLNLYLFRLSWMKKLVENGYEVYVICPRGIFFQKFSDYGIKTIEINIERGGLNIFAETQTIVRLYNICKREQFDIFHTFTIKPNIYGSIAGKLARIPNIISHITGLGYIYTENDLKANILRTLSSVLYFISFKFVKKIVFQNSDDLQTLKKLFNNDKAIIIRGTGVNTDFFSSDKIENLYVKNFKKELVGTENMIVITLIARLLANKGIKELIEAANHLIQKHKNIFFLIIGWIDKGNPAAITKDFICNAQKNPYMKFLGERNDIREILGITDIYCLPSYREGTPRTVLEAMAMEKPIITTDAPGCRSTVEDGVNGFLVPVKNSKVLAEAIERLIVNKDLRIKMGKASREKVVKEFSDEIVIRQVLSLYDEVLKDEYHKSS
ncbi:MAG: glycosyltransferase family 4 protein [Candidatus Omnitrophica bacterium]|nr:glycosyltransferase family 4 protein [Candidatus Omnitrophota bacterium]